MPQQQVGERDSADCRSSRDSDITMSATDGSSTGGCRPRWSPQGVSDWQCKMAVVAGLCATVVLRTCPARHRGRSFMIFLVTPCTPHPLRWWPDVRLCAGWSLCAGRHSSVDGTPERQDIKGLCSLTSSLITPSTDSACVTPESARAGMERRPRALIGEELLQTAPS